MRIEGEKQAQEADIRTEIMAEVQQLMDSNKEQARAAADRLQQEVAGLREQAWQAQVRSAACMQQHAKEPTSTALLLLSAHSRMCTSLVPNVQGRKSHVAICLRWLYNHSITACCVQEEAHQHEQDLHKAQADNQVGLSWHERGGAVSLGLVWVLASYGCRCM